MLLFLLHRPGPGTSTIVPLHFLHQLRIIDLCSINLVHMYNSIYSKYILYMLRKYAYVTVYIDICIHFTLCIYVNVILK